MRVIIENMFSGVMLATPGDGTILFTNARFNAMFGYDPGELHGRPASVLNAPNELTPDECARRILQELDSAGVWRGELENIKKDGTRFWCEANVTAIDHPRFGMVLVTVQLDVTPKKRALEELRRSEERLGLVLEATGSGAWDWNVQTGVVHFSPFWKSALGYSTEEVPPRVEFWEGIVHPRDMPRVRQALTKHFEGGSSIYECVTRLLKKDGSWQWNLDRGKVVERTPNGAPLRMVGTDTDLSQQRWSGLREFIPICAGCKVIRDENGTWRRLEHYFGELSLAQFSHGLCPDCIAKFSEGIPE